MALKTLPKYLAILNLAFIRAMKNDKILIGLSLFLIACMVIFSNLWRVAALKMGITSYQPEQLLWYIAFNEWILVSLPEIQLEMEQDLRTGKLAYLLPRPISYLGSKFAEATGTLLANMLFLGAVCFGFTWIWVGSLPFSLTAMLISLLFGVLAGFVGILFLMLVGLTAFWLHEVTPVQWMWEKFLFILGGLMLPLTVYPIWMQKIAVWTPFPAILGGRSALALEFNTKQVIAIGSALLFWGIISLIGLQIVYRRGLRILNIEGG